MRNEFFAHFAGVSRLSDRRVSQRLKEFTDSVVERKGTKNLSHALSRKRYSKARCRFMDAYADLVYTLLDAMTKLMESQADEFQRRSRMYKHVTKEIERKMLAQKG